MSNTVKLGLPLLEAAQAQKHVTHNEALQRLDALVHLSVISRTVAVPPLTPLEGDRYLIAASPTGAWAGQAGKLAYYSGGAWTIAVPRQGWRTWVAAESVLLVYDGAAWTSVGAGSSGPLQNLPLLGVNTTADATNKLAVASSDVLLTHAGSSARLKLNKSNASSTASLLYQTNFSGRAELGLTGDDDFHIKVSPDGSAWTEALKLKANGTVHNPGHPWCVVSRNSNSWENLAAGVNYGWGGTFHHNHANRFAFGSAAPGGGNFLVIPETGFYEVIFKAYIGGASEGRLAVTRNGWSATPFIHFLLGTAGKDRSICQVSYEYLVQGDYLGLSPPWTPIPWCYSALGHTDLSLRFMGE